MGWPSVALSELLLDASSGTWGQEAKNGELSYPVLRSTNMQNGGLTLADVAHRKVSEKTAGKYSLARGDILVTTSSGSVKHIGKNALFDLDGGQTYLYSNFTLRMRPNPELVTPAFLYHYLNSDEARAALARITSTTSGLRNLNLPLYLAQNVPRPPLEEQRRIAHLLDEADRLQRLRKEANEKAQRILPALFVEMFGDPETNPMAWRRQSAGELVEDIRNGLYKPAQFYGTGIPLLRMFNIGNDGFVSLNRVNRVEVTPGERERFGLREGDIVISRVNSAEWVGKTAIVPAAFDNGVFEAMIMRVRPNREVILPEYLAAYMSTPTVLAQIRSRAKHAINQSSISQSAITDLQVPLPPMEEQRRFAAALKTVQLFAARQESASAFLSAATDALRSQILVGLA